MCWSLWLCQCEGECGIFQSLGLTGVGESSKSMLNHRYHSGMLSGWLSNSWILEVGNADARPSMMAKYSPGLLTISSIAFHNIFSVCRRSSGLHAPRRIDNCINVALPKDLLSRFTGRRRHNGEMRRANCKGNRREELGFSFGDDLHKLAI